MRSCELVAPRTRGCKLPFWVDGCLWEVPVESGPAEGWGLWAIRGDAAHYVRPAAAWERERALPTRSREVLTLLEPRGQGAWRAAARGRREVVVHLVDQGAMLDGVRAVHDGLRWWCLGLAGGQARRARRWRAELVEGRRPPDLKPGYQVAPPPVGHAERLRRAVELAGGRLLGWSPTPNGFQVRWQRDGEQFVSLVDPELNLQQAGLCLANTDREHDLTSLVSLIRERRQG